MKLYSKILDGIDFVVGRILMVLMICFMCIVVVQIVWRFCFTPLMWTEQVSRYLFVWSVCLGVPFVTRRGQDIAFDMLLQKLPDKLRMIVNVLTRVLMLAFAVYFLYFSIQFCIGSAGLIAAGIKIPYNWVYIAQPICALFLVLVLIESIMNLFLKKEAENVN